MKSHNYKTLFVSSPKSWRGGEQQLYYLLSEFSNQNKKFAIICPFNSPLYQKCKHHNWEVYSFKKRGLLNIGIARSIIKIAKQNGFDLLHANDSHAHSAVIWANKMGLKLPIVLSRRVDFPIKNTFFSLKKYNFKYIKAIVCISEFVKKILEPSIQNKSTIKVVHDGIDVEKFKFAEKNYGLKQKFAIPNNHLIIGMVAAYAPHKDYYTFIKAAEKVLNINNQLTFFAIGEGGERIEMEKIIKQKKLDKKIILTGFIDDIPGVLKDLDIFVLSSKTEGLGTSILDAFASKVPVVATNAGGIPEMLIHQQTGLISNVGDDTEMANNILKLIQNNTLKDNLTINAFEKVKDFSFKKMALGNIEVFDNVMRF